MTIVWIVIAVLEDIKESSIGASVCPGARSSVESRMSYRCLC